MPFLLESPRVLNCFDIEVSENPQLAAKKEIPIRIDPLGKVPVGYADENLNLRFRVLDTSHRQAEIEFAGHGRARVSRARHLAATRKMMAAKGYKRRAFDSYMEIIERNKDFIKRYAFLFD